MNMTRTDGNGTETISLAEYIQRGREIEASLQQRARQTTPSNDVTAEWPAMGIENRSHEMLGLVLLVGLMLAAFLVGWIVRGWVA